MRAFFLLALLLGCATALGQDKWLRFDVSGGRFSQLIHSKLEPNTGLECRLRVTDRRFKGEWGPAFSIVLSETGHLGPGAEIGRFVELSMTFSEEDGGRFYEMRVHRQGEPKLDAVAAAGFLGESVEQVLRLGWRDDGTFSYYIFEHGNGFGEGQVSEPRVKPKVVIVTASGMGGMTSCKRYHVPTIAMSVGAADRTNCPGALRKQSSRQLARRLSWVVRR